MLYVLGIVAEVVAVVAWFAIVFTGKLPEGLGNLMALYIRYNNRVTAYAYFMREEYLPFTFDTTAGTRATIPACGRTWASSSRAATG